MFDYKYYGSKKIILKTCGGWKKDVKKKSIFPLNRGKKKNIYVKVYVGSKYSCHLRLQNLL